MMLMKKLIDTPPYPFLLCRVVTGFIFFSEGLQKFPRPGRWVLGVLLKLVSPIPLSGRILRVYSKLFVVYWCC